MDLEQLSLNKVRSLSSVLCTPFMISSEKKSLFISYRIYFILYQALILCSKRFKDIFRQTSNYLLTVTCMFLKSIVIYETKASYLRTQSYYFEKDTHFRKFSFHKFAEEVVKKKVPLKLDAVLLLSIVNVLFANCFDKCINFNTFT